MNVLLYNGNGTSPHCVKQTFLTLKRALGHAYDIIKVDAATLSTEPWEETCSLMVMPGGRDSPYCEDLDGAGTDKIRRYVENGGHYLGLCAGAYFGAKEIEFEVGTPYQVKGPRQLGFFPGLVRGCMYPGFKYNSDQGARAVQVKVSREILDSLPSGYPQAFKSYYNGGGYFVKVNGSDQVKAICHFTEKGLASDDEEAIAGVECKVGHGTAVLLGIHPEFDITLEELEDNQNRDAIKAELIESYPYCQEFLRTIFSKMGLKVLIEKSQTEVPALTPIYLSTITGELLEAVKGKMKKEIDVATGLLCDTNDIFHIAEMGHQDAEAIVSQMEKLSVEREADEKPPVLQILYPAATIGSDKVPVMPPPSWTPLFSPETFFNALKTRRQQEWGGGSWYSLGNALFYTDVITSTQTVLDKNYTFAQTLPTGLVCVATNQVAGRGRGRNAWVSQSGALQFSFIVRHSLKLSHAPVVFLQYITAMAIVESIRTRKGYEEVPLRVKWPNDVYADLPDQGLKKVSGLIVNSSFLQDEFLLVIGCGINLNNAHPTVSINEIIRQHNPALAPLKREEMLADVLVTFEKMYNEFCEKGMGSWFLDMYYRRWLHSDKLVTLTTHDNERVRIIGITSDYGMLEAVSVDNPRKRFTLQPDGNSFDMLKGLITKKT
ncbi:class II aaRS and biotin synthetase [Backusella circina FSU 941]|nr:class II aaRS and biotin synthetase [Backusella circina FSU 941]